MLILLDRFSRREMRLVECHPNADDTLLHMVVTMLKKGIFMVRQTRVPHKTSEDDHLSWAILGEDMGTLQEDAVHEKQLKKENTTS